MKKYLSLFIFLVFLTNTIYSQVPSPIIPLNNIKLVNTDSLSLLQMKVYDDLLPLKPNFLTLFDFEIIIPVGEEDLYLSKITDLLTDFSRYSEIPYYSKQNNSWHKLFYDLEQSYTFNDSWTEILNLRMQPFEQGELQVSMESGHSGIFFNITNIDPMYYGIIRAARAHNMRISLSVEKAPGKIMFYGLGGAKAFGGFGSLRKRLDVAFNGRIESFFLWINNEIKQIIIEE